MLELLTAPVYYRGKASGLTRAALVFLAFFFVLLVVFVYAKVAVITLELGELGFLQHKCTSILLPKKTTSWWADADPKPDRMP